MEITFLDERGFVPAASPSREPINGSCFESSSPSGSSRSRRGSRNATPATDPGMRELGEPSRPGGTGMSEEVRASPRGRSLQNKDRLDHSSSQAGQPKKPSGLRETETDDRGSGSGRALSGQQRRSTRSEALRDGSPRGKLGSSCNSSKAKGSFPKSASTHDDRDADTADPARRHRRHTSEVARRSFGAEEEAHSRKEAKPTYHRMLFKLCVAPGPGATLASETEMEGPAQVGPGGPGVHRGAGGGEKRTPLYLELETMLKEGDKDSLAPTAGAHKKPPRRKSVSGRSHSCGDVVVPHGEGAEGAQGTEVPALCLPPDGVLRIQRGEGSGRLASPSRDKRTVQGGSGTRQEGEGSRGAHSGVVGTPPRGMPRESQFTVGQGLEGTTARVVPRSSTSPGSHGSGGGPEPQLIPNIITRVPPRIQIPRVSSGPRSSTGGSWDERKEVGLPLGEGEFQGSMGPVLDYAPVMGLGTPPRVSPRDHEPVRLGISPQHQPHQRVGFIPSSSSTSSSSSASAFSVMPSSRSSSSAAASAGTRFHSESATHGRSSSVFEFEAKKGSNVGSHALPSLSVPSSPMALHGSANLFSPRPISPLNPMGVPAANGAPLPSPQTLVPHHNPQHLNRLQPPSSERRAMTAGPAVVEAGSAQVQHGLHSSVPGDRPPSVRRTSTTSSDPAERLSTWGPLQGTASRTADAAPLMRRAATSMDAGEASHGGWAPPSGRPHAWGGSPLEEQISGARPQAPLQAQEQQQPHSPLSQHQAQSPSYLLGRGRGGLPPLSPRGGMPPLSPRSAGQAMVSGCPIPSPRHTSAGPVAHPGLPQFPPPNAPSDSEAEAPLCLPATAGAAHSSPLASPRLVSAAEGALPVFGRGRAPSPQHHTGADGETLFCLPVAPVVNSNSIRQDGALPSSAPGGGNEVHGQGEGEEEAEENKHEEFRRSGTVSSEYESGVTIDGELEEYGVEEAEEEEAEEWEDEDEDEEAETRSVQELKRVEEMIGGALVSWNATASAILRTGSGVTIDGEMEDLEEEFLEALQAASMTGDGGASDSDGGRATAWGRQGAVPRPGYSGLGTGGKPGPTPLATPSGKPPLGKLPPAKSRFAPSAAPRTQQHAASPLTGIAWDQSAGDGALAPSVGGEELGLAERRQILAQRGTCAAIQAWLQGQGGSFSEMGDNEPAEVETRVEVPPLPGKVQKRRVTWCSSVEEMEEVKAGRAREAQAAAVFTRQGTKGRAPLFSSRRTKSATNDDDGDGSAPVPGKFPRQATKGRGPGGDGGGLEVVDDVAGDDDDDDDVVPLGKFPRQATKGRPSQPEEEEEEVSPGKFPRQATKGRPRAKDFSPEEALEQSFAELGFYDSSRWAKHSAASKASPSASASDRHGKACNGRAPTATPEVDAEAGCEIFLLAS